MARGSLKSRLLIWFLVFSFLTILLIIPFNTFYFKRKNKIREMTESVKEMHISFFKIMKAQNNFFIYETSNNYFFATRQSPYLTTYNINLDDLKNLINNIQSNSLVRKDDKLINEFAYLSQAIANYSVIYKKLVDLIAERGFKDFGIEGRMRNEIHRLETFQQLDQTKVLSLRRHEKDYIIRGEELYIDNLNRLAKRFIKEVEENRMELTVAEKDTVIRVLHRYADLFNQLVENERISGIRNNSGLKGKLNEQGEIIEEEFNILQHTTEAYSSILLNKLRLLYSGFFIAIIVLSIGSSIYISGKITNPLKRLTEYIASLKKNDFAEKISYDNDNAHQEIYLLMHEFKELINLMKRRERERDTALQEIIRTNHDLRDLSEMLPVCVFETDKMGNLSYVNKTWYNTFGYNKKDIEEGLNLIETIGSDKKDNAIEEISDYKARKKDGISFPAIMYTSNIIREGNCVGKRGIIIDNSVRKRYIELLKKEKQKAEQSDKLKSAFLANMSHEIRTPMNAILGFSELLLNRNLGREERDEFLQYIRNSGNSLLNIIDDIIDIAKIEAGELKIVFQSFDINYLLDQLEIEFVEIQRFRYPQKNVRIISVKPFEDGCIINSDINRLKQIFSNLLINALKFTESGSIVFGYSPAENGIEFFVKDTGIGIPEDQIDTVFERFRQVDNTHVKNEGGTGLGLTICNNLVALLGGKLNVKSKENEGSIFYFSLPYHPKDFKNVERKDESSLNMPFVPVDIKISSEESK